MFCLKCSARSVDDHIDFAFEVHPYWSLNTMIRLALDFLNEHYFDDFSSTMCISFFKVSDYELQEDDIMVDLILYAEEGYNAILRNKRQ